MKNLCNNPTIYRGGKRIPAPKVALATEIRAEAKVFLSVCFPHPEGWGYCTDGFSLLRNISN